jgi:hypothetical protein
MSIVKDREIHRRGAENAEYYGRKRGGNIKFPFLRVLSAISAPLR